MDEALHQRAAAGVRLPRPKAYNNRYGRVNAMRTKQLGSAGLEVPVVSVGCWSLGGSAED